MKRAALALALILGVAGCSTAPGDQVPMSGPAVSQSPNSAAEPSGTPKTVPSGGPSMGPPSVPPTGPPPSRPPSAQATSSTAVIQPTPNLLGLGLGQAETQVFGSGVRLGPYLMAPGSPYAPGCLIVEQQPPPGAPLMADLIRVRVECQGGPPSAGE